MKKNILVAVAHPDDEVLGVGGTIKKHADKGDAVFVLFMADGEKSRASAVNNDVSARQDAANKVAKILGIKETYFADFPDNRMDEIALLDVAKYFEEYIAKIKPDVIYTHHGGDLNVDHRMVFEAVMTAARPIKGNAYPKQIYCFETLSSTEWGIHKGFQPDTFINIEEQMSAKIDALKEYDNEMRDFPHPRSYQAVEALAKLRGSVVALNAAEAFTCIRNIQD